jgi:hypothetical protein
MTDLLPPTTDMPTNTLEMPKVVSREKWPSHVLRHMPLIDIHYPSSNPLSVDVLRRHP